MSFGRLFKKVARIAGGYYDLEKRQTSTLSNYFKTLIKYIFSTYQEFANVSLSNKLSIKQKTQVILVIVFILRNIENKFA